MQTFEESGIRPELIKAIEELGFISPMPVQAEVIPEVLNTDRDIIALAQTGTGKTAAFGLPLISRLDIEMAKPQVIVLSPTRELCVQIANDLNDYAKYLNYFRVVAVYGGASIENQIKTLKDGVQVIVATPGRMNDIIRRKKVDLTQINTLVLDEADVMLDMGFAEELNSILEHIPDGRRTLLFSATMPQEIMNITRNYMQNPREITVGTRNSGTSNVSHHYYMVNAKDRYLALKRIVDFYPDIYGIIFCRTRNETAEIAEKLMKDGYHADALHGDLSQVQRDYTMNRFRMRNLQMLVATDVAARGIDVDSLTHIINYNLPDDSELYNHRSGRTGRANKSGVSISIIHQREKYRIANFEKAIKQKFEFKKVPSGFEVCKKQLINMVDRMENVAVNEEEIEGFLPEVFAKLSWLSKEDMIKRFVSLEFNRFLEYYKKAPDLNVDERKEQKRQDSEGGSSIKPATEFTVMRLNMGKMDDFSVRGLIGMVNDFTQNRSIAIGKADIREQYTLFAIDSSAVDEVFQAFKGRDYKGRQLSIEVARKKDQELARVSFSADRKRERPGGQGRRKEWNNNPSEKRFGRRTEGSDRPSSRRSGSDQPATTDRRKPAEKFEFDQSGSWGKTDKKKSYSPEKKKSRSDDKYRRK